MLKLLQFELIKIYKNKITLIVLIFMCIITLYNVTQYKFSATSVENAKIADKNLSSLKGTYDIKNYKTILHRYEKLLQKMKNNAYSSTAQCPSEIENFDPDIARYIKNKTDTCAKLEDAQKAQSYIMLYQSFMPIFEFDKKIQGESIKNTLLRNLTTSSTDFNSYTPLTKNTANKLVNILDHTYKTSKFYYEPSASSVYPVFIEFMRSRSIHYITFVILIGLCSIFTVDFKYHTKEQVITAKKGRSTILYARIFASLFFGMSVFIILSLITFLPLANQYDTSLGSISIQFINALNDYSLLMMNLFHFTLLFIALLALYAIAISFFVLLISSFSKHTYASFLLSLFLLYSPTILMTMNQFLFNIFRFSLINTSDITQITSTAAGIEIHGIYVSFITATIVIYAAVILVSFFSIRWHERKTLRY